MTKTIAIIGATGTNAGPWTDAFLGAGWRVRSVVRDPEGVPPRPNRTATAIDLDDSRTYQPALAGVDRLALVTPAMPRQLDREIGLIEAARRAGVSGIIKLSVIGAELPTPISAFARWSAQVDQALAAADVPHVLLRANAFMQNLLRQRTTIEAGLFVEPLGNSAVSYLDVRDIADVAVAVADGPFDGRSLVLTGPAAMTGTEIAAVRSAASGKPVRFVSPDLRVFRANLVERGMAAWQADALVELYSAVQAGKGPHLATVSAAVTAATGRPPRTVQQFAQDAFGSLRD